ncbi:MAG: glycosyltransferase family 2 protein [Candidatus Omnitrophica bacterium]|nr:glycosyltransferase family 2 protein [Candidatus Omnitrophota bacterium]
MNGFRYSPLAETSAEQALQRRLEMIPGALSWTCLVGLAGLSFFYPRTAAVIIIAFYIYWLFKLFYMTLFLVLSYMRLSVERRTDWMARVVELDEWGRGARSVREGGHDARRGLAGRLSAWIHRRAAEELVLSGSPPPLSSQIYHLIIYPIANERRGVYEAGIESLTRQAFPTGRMVVILAVEGRAREEVKKDAEEVRGRYGTQFFAFRVVYHPPDLAGEARVKGANATWAAREAARFLDARDIPYGHVVVSCFDADTTVSPDYFSCLTYHYVTCPNRTRASFQPIPVYHNNVWDVPAFARLLDVGGSFFQLVEATYPESLVTFSSHSMSFKALAEVGYWPVDMISDDSAIFWKAYLHYEGDYYTVPMYVTVSMDVARGPSWLKTAATVYKQKRRWAWGVENFPIVARGFLKASRIPLTQRIRHVLKMLEGHVAWAAWPFLLTVVGWLPGIFAGREFATSVMYYTAPRVAGIIFRLATVALGTTILLSLLLLPRPKPPFASLKRLAHALEWLFVPVVVVLFSGLPALDAQTRLMLGKRLEFSVTEKGSLSGRGSPRDRKTCSVP